MLMLLLNSGNLNFICMPLQVYFYMLPVVVNLSLYFMETPYMHSALALGCLYDSMTQVLVSIPR